MSFDDAIPGYISDRHLPLTVRAHRYNVTIRRQLRAHQELGQTALTLGEVPGSYANPFDEPPVIWIGRRLVIRPLWRPCCGSYVCTCGPDYAARSAELRERVEAERLAVSKRYKKGT